MTPAASPLLELLGLLGGPSSALIAVTTALATLALAPSLLARGSASARHALLGVALALVCAASVGVAGWQLVTSAAATAAAPDAPSSVQSFELTGGRRLADSAVGPVVRVWAVVSALLFARLVLSVLAVAAVRRRCTHVTDPAIRDALARCASRLRVRRGVTLVWGEARSVPATWGVFAPVVMLPPAAAAWTDDRRDAVLLHELAHVARHDALAQLIRQLVCALHWFNPLVWVLAWRHELEAELACDECVVRAGADPLDYAAHLVELARAYRGNPAPPQITIAVARSASEVETRVRALVTRERPRRAPERVAVLGGLTLSAGAVIALLWWVRADVARRGHVVTGLRDAPSQPLRIEPREGARWRGAVEDGRWLEVSTGVGDVRVVSSDDTVAEVSARPRVGVLGASVGLVVVRGRDGDVQVCVRDVSAESGAPDCSSASPASRVPVDVVVRVPSRVRVGAHTRRGDIDATRLRSQVWATAGVGRVTVSTTRTAEASADSGDVVARVGASDWSSDVEFTTGAGLVDVTVPAGVRATAELVAERGAVRSDFALPLTRWRLPREAAVGVLGPAGGPAPVGRLTLRAGRGDVVLRRATN